MNNDLKILITSGLNIGRSIGEINAAISGLEKKVKKLKLKIEVPVNFNTHIQSFIKATEKMKSVADEQNKVISETQDIYKKLDGTVTQVSQKVLKSGEIIQKTKTIHDANKKSMQDETLAADKLAKAVDKLNNSELDSITVLKNKANATKGYRVVSSEGNTVTTQKLESDGQTLIGSSTTTNFKKQRNDELKEIARLNKEAETLDRNHFMALKDNHKRTEDMEKLHYLALQKNRQRDIDYQQSIAKQQQKISDTIRRYGADSAVKGQLQSLSQQLNTVTSTGNYKNALNNIDIQLKQITASAKTASSHTLGFMEQLKVAAQRIPLWMGAMTLFYFPLRQFQSGLESIYNIDTALTNLKKVTEGTAEEYRNFTRDAAETAKQIGGLTVDVISASAEWARLGYSIAQVNALAKQTLVYQNVGDIKDAETASQSLISTIKGFGIEVDNEGKNVAKIVDIYNEVGNKFAISSAGIGESMRRSAASLSEAGNTIEESVALATAANSTIQDPARVGQALKTVSMRLRGISDEGEDLTELIPSLEKKFQSIGLTLKKDDTTFKNTYEIFKDLSSVWKDLNDFQRSEILELVAGKLQGNIAASLISNFKDAEGALKAGLDSFGSAAKENERFLDSMQGKIKNLKNEATDFWLSSLNSEFLKSVIDAGSKTINVLDNLGNVVAITSGAFLLFKSQAIAALIVGAYSSVKALFTAKTAFESTAVAAGTTTAAVNGTSVALVGLQRALGVVGLVLTAGSVLYSVFNQLNQATEISTKLIEDNNKKYNEQADAIKNALSYYEQNYQAIQSDSNVKDQLFQIQNKLIDTFGTEAKGLDLVNGKYDEQIKKIQTLKDKSLDNRIKDNQIIVDSIQQRKYSNPELTNSTRNAMFGGTQSYDISGNVDVGDLGLEEYYKKLLDLQDRIRNKNTDIFAGQKLIPENAKEWENAINAVQNKIAELEPQYNQIIALEDDKKTRVKDSALEQINLTSDQLLMFNRINSAVKDQSIDQYRVSIHEVLSAITSADTTNISKIIDSVKQLPSVVSNDLIVKNLSNLQLGLKEVSIKAVNTETVFRDLNKTYEDSVKEIEPYNRILQDIAEGKELNTETVMELALQEKSLVNAITIENGQLKINQQAVESLRDAKIVLYTNQIELSKKALEDQAINLGKELNNYGIQINGIKEVAEAKRKLMEMDAPATGSPISTEWLNNLTRISALTDIEKSYDRLEKLKQLASTGLKSVGTSASKPKKDETQATLHTSTDFTKEEIANINNIIAVREQNIKSLERQIQTAKKAEDYNKTLDLTNQLLIEQKNKIDDINQANDGLRNSANNIRSFNDDYKKHSEMYSQDGIGFDAWFNDDATASKTYIDAIHQIDKDIQNIEGTGRNLTDTQKVQIKDLENQKSLYEKIFNQIQLFKQAWQGNAEEVLKVSDIISGLEEELSQLAKEHRENEFKLSENWISEEITRMTLAGKTEIEIAQMVLDARLRMADERWTKERGIIALSESEQLSADKNVYDARMKLLELSEQKNKKLEEIARKVVDAHRKSLEYQRDEQLKDLEKIAEQQEKNHNDKMKQLDDELQKYKNSVDEQLSLLDKLNEKEDFDSELSKKQSDAQKIQSQINVLAIDDSIETKAKREQLEKDLQSKLEEIEKFKEDRSRKLRRDSLQEQLNQKEKEIEASKKAEDAKYEGIKNGLKNVEDARKVYWENVLNNDAYFAQMESEIIAGNISTIEDSLNGLKNEISSNTSEMGKSIRNNLVAELENALRLLQAVSLGNVSNVVVDSALAQKRSDHSKYIQNKVEWESLSKSAKPNLERMTQLNIENEAFRKKYGFADYDYEDIIKGNVARFDTGGMTPAFGTQPKLAFLDEKELILDKFDTSKLLKVIDVTRNIFESIRRPNFNNIRFNRTEPVANGPTYNLNLRIDQVTGDRKGGETVFNTVIKNFQKMGN